MLNMKKAINLKIRGLNMNGKNFAHLAALIIFAIFSLASKAEPGAEQATISKKEHEAILKEHQEHTKELEKGLAQSNKKIDDLKNQLAASQKGGEKIREGYFRRLFVANSYFVRGKPGGNIPPFNRMKYSYTSLFLGEPNLGFLWNRVNIASRVAVGQNSPITESEAPNYNNCTDITISKKKISQSCKIFEAYEYTKDCDRVDSKNYECTVSRYDFKTKKSQFWFGRLELLEIYDPMLK